MNQLPLPMPTALAAREALFRAADGHPMTTSRAVALRFGKTHKDVLKALENLRAKCTDLEFWRRNFAPRNYMDRRGKEQPEYCLTHDGFAFLVMRFTGKEAIAWQIAFIEAFNQMEAELLAFYAQRAQALSLLRPMLDPVVKGKQAGLNRAAIGAPLGRTPASITYHTGQARRFGLLPARVAPTPTTATLH